MTSSYEKKVLAQADHVAVSPMSPRLYGGIEKDNQSIHQHSHNELRPVGLLAQEHARIRHAMAQSDQLQDYTNYEENR
jgi:hypothetical protein